MIQAIEDREAEIWKAWVTHISVEEVRWILPNSGSL